MPKLKFVGDDASSFTEVYGTVFVLGKPTSVDHLSDEKVLTLMGNPMFVHVEDDAEDTSGAGPVIIAGQGLAAPVPAADQVEIPEGWDAMDFMSLKTLAKKIDPTIANDATKDVCVEAIEAELGKRAAKA